MTVVPERSNLVSYPFEAHGNFQNQALEVQGWGFDSEAPEGSVFRMGGGDWSWSKGGLRGKVKV